MRSTGGVMLTRENQITWREMSQCYFIHHKSHKDCSGIQAGSLWWEISVYSYKVCR